MDPKSKALKEKIDLFIQDSLKTIKKAKRNHSEINEKEANALSKRIYELYRSANALLATRPSESNYYNAKMIKDLIEQKFGQNKKSLLDAANKATRLAKPEALESIIRTLAEKDEAREIFFSDLQDISDDLAA